MKVLVTRPAAAAARLMSKLRARRHDVILAPMLTIEPQGFQTGGDAVGAVAITSANAIPAMTGANIIRNIPVYAVGRSSAAAATAAGFEDVRAANGDVESLCQLIRESWAPTDGKIIHLAGEHSVGDLTGALTADGYRAETQIVYRAIAATDLPQEAISALSGGEIDAALFFSPRTAQTLLSLLKANNDADLLIGALKEVQAIAISNAVADELQPELWRAVETAPQKNTEGVLEALDAVAIQP